jgi:hypothetical protein
VVAKRRKQTLKPLPFVSQMKNSIGKATMGTERKQSKNYSGRPVLLGDRKMTLFLEKPPDNINPTKRKMTNLVSEVVEYTKPYHLRTHAFEGPKLSIFGPSVDIHTDQDDLANLDLTRSRTNSMRKLHDDAMACAGGRLKDDDVFWRPPPPKERDVVDVIKERLGRLHKGFEPPELPEGPADVLITYKKTRTDNTKLLIRVHSRVLRRHCNAFLELLESGMREMTLREFLDRQFMRSRQFGNPTCDDCKLISSQNLYKVKIFHCLFQTECVCIEY